MVTDGKIAVTWSIIKCLPVVVELNRAHHRNEQIAHVPIINLPFSYDKDLSQNNYGSSGKRHSRRISINSKVSYHEETSLIDDRQLFGKSEIFSSRWCARFISITTGRKFMIDYVTAIFSSVTVTLHWSPEVPPSVTTATIGHLSKIPVTLKSMKSP